MDYMSMHDWFYGPPEPTWILPATSYYYPPAPPAFLHAGTTSLYEPAAQNYTRSSMQYAKKLQEAAAPDQPAARPLRSTAAATAYEQPDQQQQQLGRRMYNHVKELGEEESDELKKNLMSGDSSTSNNYYHVYPKVQTAADGPVRTHQESRARMVDGQGSEVSHEKLVSKEIKKKESSPAAFPFKNLPIELKVPMCCEKCAKKVYDKILDLPGVADVTTDQYNQKVIVTGNVDPSRVLSRVKQVKKHSVFWDQNVEYSQVYLKKQKDREMAMIQAGKKQQQQASESSSSSASAAKGSSSSLQKLALDGKGGSPNTTSSSMIHQQFPEHETSRQTKKQLYQSSHDEADGKLMQGPNVRGMMNNILGPRAESNPQRSSRMQYHEAAAREEQDMNHKLPGPNVQVNILPESGAIQRMMPGFESESRLHTHQQQYPSPDHLKGYRQELYNAQSAGLRWPDDDEEQHHHHHHYQHHNRQPEELLYAHYNPYVRN